jgi:hypothetical protein
VKSILVVGTNNTLGRQLVNFLVDKGYQIKILAEENNYFDLALLPEILAINLANEQKIDSQLLTQADGIVICLDENTSEFNPNFGQTIFSFQQLNRLIDSLSELSNNLEKTLFDFNNSNSNLQSVWGTVDDVVMGGVSQSQFNLTDNRGIFTGYVSTDNNGGFASVRTRNFDFPLDLSGYQGIELRLQGDGQRYKFIARCEGQWDGLSYCYSFDTMNNIPLTIRIPFQELRPVFRAKTVREAGKFDVSQVYSLQLMLSKFEYDGELNSQFQPGNFDLSIESIKAYQEGNIPKLIVMNGGNNDSLEKAIAEHNFNYTLIDKSLFDYSSKDFIAAFQDCLA